MVRTLLAVAALGSGARVVATGEDAGEDLPAELRLALTPAAGNESQSSWSASLFPDDGLPPHEKRILSLLKADQAAHVAAVMAASNEQPNSREREWREAP